MASKLMKHFLFSLIIFVSFFFCAQVYSADIPLSAENYAPNLWFDSQEQYYPANPLDFYFENNIEISGEKAVQKYNKLSQQEKINKLTVFYNIQDEGDQLIYQYWFFYVFNDYQISVKNKHYGDWEAVYIFVNKNSGEVNKAIGTSHQRKIFDTEIYNPKTNHIWSYIGNGSHANCVDKIDDGYCDFFKWREFEKWDKNGYKAEHNSYNLIKITPEYINQFNKAKTLENSPVLGINIFDFLMIENKEFYLPLGGNPPIYAWEQSSYYNPNEIRPISVKYITEYVSGKIESAKNAIVGLFKKVEPKNQQAGIVLSLEKEEPESRLYISRPCLEEKPVIEPKIQIAIEPEIVIEQEIITQELSSATPPLGLPFFIGGGMSSTENNPIPVSTSSTTTTTTTASTSTPPSTPTPTSTPDIISPSTIIDLSASAGDSRETINLSWTAPGDDQSTGTSTEYIIKYATSSEITSLNWASSTDIINEPIPNIASSSESLLISNLDINQTYYFAIKSKDEADNISNISNCASSTASALGDNVIINEVQLGGDEFVELYNPTEQDIDMSDWYWSYFSETRDWDNPYRNKSFSEAPNTPIIPAGGYYLIGVNGYPETNGYVNADWAVYSYDFLSGTNGSIAIFPWDPTGKTVAEAQDGAVDTIGWGSADCVYETSAVSASEDNKSLIRNVDGWDTNNNNDDFTESDWPTPQNSQGDKAAIIADTFSFTENTTWTLDDSVYILRSSSSKYPTIQDGAVLTIEPGVTIKGSNKHYPSLIIKGSLKAEGTSANPITFTSATTTQLAGDWSGIIFDNSTSADSVLDYVTFQYGGYDVRYGTDTNIKAMIKIDNSFVTIKNSSFENNLYNGIRLVNSNSLISDSNFSSSTLSGIVISGSSPSISDSQFSNNDIGIEIIDQALPTITNNIFSNNNYPIKIKNSYPNLSANQANNNNMNGVFIDSESIFSQNTTWNSNLPYVLGAGLGDCLTIATGTILTIEPGMVIKSDRPYTILSIEGELIALGATSTPIIFTSLKDDTYGGDTNNDGATAPASGDWKNIEFAAGSIGNLDYIHFRYGGYKTSDILDIDANAVVNQDNITYYPE